MRPFEYARPTTEEQAVELLNDHGGDTAVLAGGTDLIHLLKKELVNPKRVVDLKRVESMRGIHPTANGLFIGSMTTLEEMLDSPLLQDYQSLLHVAEEVRSIQVQSMGTIGGDLCHLPNCWYFRNGYGLLGIEGRTSLPQEGDNRYHAIFGNHGPAKFVCASRLAPALIAWGAKVRILVPEPDQEQLLPLERLYHSPLKASQGITILKPGQLISHIVLPPSGSLQSASYEVLESAGLDWPLGAASATIELQAGMVTHAKIVLGHVAPTPWISEPAANTIIGRSLNEESAMLAGDAAISEATPLKHNEYKLSITRTAVARALLRAAGLWKEGF